MDKLPNKTAREIWDITVDLTPWIGDGAVVASFNAEVLSGSITLSNAQLLDNSTARFRLSGGDPLSTSVFSAYATMADGQVFDDTASVFVAG